MMTLSEDQNQQSAPAPQGGEDQSRDDRSGRRRRRGRRGGGSREEGQPQRSDNEASSETSPEAPQTPRQQPPRRNVSGGAPDQQAQSQPPTGDGTSPVGESGERSGRNRRRNRNRGRGDANDAPGGNNQQRPSQPAGPASSPSQERQRQQRPGQGQGQGQRPDQSKGEKKERPPRGSVLNRRSTRGEYVDAPKQREETPTYVPVSAATVEQYVNGHKGWQKEVLTTLRGIVHAVSPDIEESIMWSQPVFSANGPVCFFKAYKDSVTFGFWRGTELSDPDGLLSGDLTMMRTMTLRSAKDVRREAFEAMVKQAVRLNREKGDPTLS